MLPVKTGATRKRTVLVLVMALGAGLPPPAQAYLLDFTVASINPGVLISYAGSHLPGPPPGENNLKVIDVSPTGNLKRQLRPSITPPNKNLHCQTGPRVDYGSQVPAAPSVWTPGGLSPQGFTTVQGGISCRNMSDGTTLVSGSSGTANVMEPTYVWGNSFFSVAGSNFTDNKNDAWPAALGFHHQTADGNFDPGFPASFASVPSGFSGAVVPSGNILHHLAPFSSTLLLLGSGLMGLVGLRYRRRRG
jgi:hypothetical protein